MRIAVTGATGFLGRPLVERLTLSGHEVLVLTRRPDAQRDQLPKGARALKFDAEQGATPGLLDGCEAVLHLAGEPILGLFTEAHKRRVLESRVKGTSAIVQAACMSPSVKTLVSASAIGFYGDRGNERLTEASPPGNDFMAQVCVAWENALQPATRHGLRTACVRIGIVLHPDGGRLGAQLPIFKLGLGGALGTGEQYVSWIHRDDLLGILEHALFQASLTGALNGTAPHPATEREFTRALSTALHRPAFFRVPKMALRLGLGELSQVMLASQRVEPERTLQTGYVFRYPELNAALADLLGKPLPVAAQPQQQA